MFKHGRFLQKFFQERGQSCLRDLGTGNEIGGQSCPYSLGAGLAARRCLLLATGENKARIVAGAIEGPVRSRISTTALQFHPYCVVVRDEAVAGRLREGEYYRWIFENQPQWGGLSATAQELAIWTVIHSSPAGGKRKMPGYSLEAD